MTKPTPWSEASSDADPVLRAVLRYAQDLEPSAQDLAALAAAVARAEAKPPAPRFSSRRTLRWAGACAGVAATGVALGMTFTPSSSAPPPPRAMASERAAVPEAKPLAPAAAPPLAVSTPLPVASAAVPSRAPSATAATPRVASSAPLASSAPASVDAGGELELLTQARRELRSEPSHALAALSTHQRLFPSSGFAEERAALRVEALFGLGRSAEAEREYAGFSASYPSSIYALRLKAASQRR